MRRGSSGCWGLTAVGCLTLASFLQLGSTLDMQWLPEDADGPLPMSKIHRDKLAELCNTIEKVGGPGLPPDVPPSKAATIRSMCKRLRDAEQASGDQDGPASPFFFVLLVIGVAILWNWVVRLTRREGDFVSTCVFQHPNLRAENVLGWMGSWIQCRFIIYHRTVPGPLQSYRARKIYKKQPTKPGDASGGGAGMTAEQLQAARDARLSRFEAKPADKTD